MRNLAKAFLIILIVGTSLAKAEEGKTIPEKCNFAPTAKITNTPTGLVFRSGSEVQFSGTTSTPNNCSGSITEYRWKIEGVYSYSSTKSHTFTLPAGVHEQTYSVELRVRNNASPNLYNTKTITVTVKRPQRVYHLKDHIGNVRTSVDVDGNVLGHDDYYAFGLSMPGAHSSNTSNPNDNYKFTGHEKDDEAGLDIFHANARAYDPTIGRFMQVDPLVDRFPGWTPYHYVHNNPLNLIDPTGMSACLKKPCPKVEYGVNKTTPTGKRVAGFDITGNGGNVYYGVSGFGAGYNQVWTESSVTTQSQVYGLRGEATSKAGSEELNIETTLEGSIYMAESNSEFAYDGFDGEGKDGFIAEIDVGAYAFKADVTSVAQIQIFGRNYSIGVTRGTSFGSAHGGGAAAFKKDHDTGETRAAFSVHGGLGVGFKLGIDFNSSRISDD